MTLEQRELITSGLIADIARYLSAEEPYQLTSESVKLQNENYLPCNTVEGLNETHLFIEVDYIALESLLNSLLSKWDINSLKGRYCYVDEIREIAKATSDN